MNEEHQHRAAEMSVPDLRLTYNIFLP